MAEEKSRGVLSKYNDVEGTGLITPDEGGDDLFVHHSDIIISAGFGTLKEGQVSGTLKEGQVVEFLVILDGDKIKAVDVTGPDGFPLNRNESYGGCVNVTGCVPLDRNEGKCGSFGGRGGGYGNSNGGRSKNDSYYRHSSISEGEVCCNCGRTGHLGNNCESLVIGIGGCSGECYNCGRNGHLAKDCDRLVRVRNCGGGGRTGECYNCGRIGHLAKDCNSLIRIGGKRAEESDRIRGAGRLGECYICERTGHLAKDCDSLLRGGDGGRGSGAGYTSRRGSGGGNTSCYKCGGLDHLARYCRQATGSGDGFSGSNFSGGSMCFKCGGFGHIARHCTIVE